MNKMNNKMNDGIPGLSIYPGHHHVPVLENTVQPMQITRPKPKQITKPTQMVASKSKTCSMTLKEMMHSPELRDYQNQNPTSTIFMTEIHEKMFYSGDKGIYSEESRKTMMTTDKTLFERMLSGY